MRVSSLAFYQRLNFMIGAQMARLFYWLIEHVGRTKAMSLFSKVGAHISCASMSHLLIHNMKVAQLQVPVELLTYNVDWDVLRAEFNVLVADLEEDADFDSIINPPMELTEYTEVLEKAKRYAKRLSTDLESATQGHAFVNGKHFELNDVSNCMPSVAQRLTVTLGIPP